MANTENWKTTKVSDGVKVDQLRSWKYFSDYVYQNFSNTRNYIFRGQRREDWGLTPTLHRAIMNKWGSESFYKIANDHLDRFKLATRGRRKMSLLGLEPEDDEIWALGQHQGLKTPLLDWTKSPFVAAYFAFLIDRPDKTDNRVVFAISTSIIEDMSHWIGNNRDKLGYSGSPPKLEIFEPNSNENPNLVNQNGLFTTGLAFVEIQSWVKKYYPKWIKESPLHEKNIALFKLLIPNGGRIGFLKSLNQMNINHLTLFPSLYGASKYCNFELEIEEE
jgi:hypothetical protein